MTDEEIENCLRAPYPRIELSGGRFVLHRSESESHEIDSPALPILIASIFDYLPDDETRVDFLLALLKLAGGRDAKLEALIKDIRAQSGMDERLI